MFCDVSKSTINLSNLFSFLLFALSVASTLFSLLLFSLSFTFLKVLRCLQIYYQPINFVFFFTFCTECNFNLVFFTFALSFTFLSVLRCLQIYYQLIKFVFFFTFCIECSFNFVFFLLFALSVASTLFSFLLFSLSFTFLNALRGVGGRGFSLSGLPFSLPIFFGSTM